MSDDIDITKSPTYLLARHEKECEIRYGQLKVEIAALKVQVATNTRALWWLVGVIASAAATIVFTLIKFLN